MHRDLFEAMVKEVIDEFAVAEDLKNRISDIGLIIVDGNLRAVMLADETWWTQELDRDLIQRALDRWAGKER